MAEEMEVKDAEQENPGDILEILEKPAVIVKIAEEKLTAEVESVPHTKPVDEEWLEEGKLKPESIEPKDEWDKLWAKLRKLTAKTEKVENRIQETQRKLNSLKDKKEEGKPTIDVPTTELAVAETPALTGRCLQKKRKNRRARKRKIES